MPPHDQHTFNSLSIGPSLQEVAKYGSSRLWYTHQHACYALTTAVMIATCAALAFTLSSPRILRFAPSLRSSISQASRTTLSGNRRLIGSATVLPVRMMVPAATLNGSTELLPGVEVTLSVTPRAEAKPDIFWGSATAAYQVCTHCHHCFVRRISHAVFAGITPPKPSQAVLN